MKIITIASIDLGVNAGPSVHYLELWNSYKKKYKNDEIIGIVGNWTNKQPIIKNNFKLKKINLPKKQ